MSRDEKSLEKVLMLEETLYDVVPLEKSHLRQSG